jgi:hypothetical protein
VYLSIEMPDDAPFDLPAIGDLVQANVHRAILPLGVSLPDIPGMRVSQMTHDEIEITWPQDLTPQQIFQRLYGTSEAPDVQQFPFVGETLTGIDGYRASWSSMSLNPSAEIAAAWVDSGLPFMFHEDGRVEAIPAVPAQPVPPSGTRSVQPEADEHYELVRELVSRLLRPETDEALVAVVERALRSRRYSRVALEALLDMAPALIRVEMPVAEVGPSGRTAWERIAERAGPR